MKIQKTKKRLKLDQGFKIRVSSSQIFDRKLTSSLKDDAEESKSDLYSIIESSSPYSSRGKSRFLSPDKASSQNDEEEKDKYSLHTDDGISNPGRKDEDELEDEEIEHITPEEEKVEELPDIKDNLESLLIKWTDENKEEKIEEDEGSLNLLKSRSERVVNKKIMQEIEDYGKLK